MKDMSIVMVDGNKAVPFINEKQITVVSGDAKCPSISAASIIAKVTRDRLLYDYDKKYFYTGTGDDGITPSKDNIVLDAQVWACMSLREEFTPYMDSLSIVEQMENEEGAYPFCAANQNGGWWTEGTAYTALMYRLIGNDEKAFAAMDALAAIQQDNGLFPAATVDNLSTGFELFNGDAWEYSTDAHIAPTAWFILAYNSFNPYSF